MLRNKRILSLCLGFLLVSSLVLSSCSGHKETTTYTFPDVYVGASDLVKNYQNSGRCEDIYENEDGSLTLVLTERQRKQWADTNETKVFLALLNQMGVEISYSDDYRKMSISAPDGVAEAASPMILNFAWKAEQQQILNGAKDWSLEVTVINRDTGAVTQQVTLPEEELDWSFVSP